MKIKPFHETLNQPTYDKTYTVEQGEFAPLLFVCFFIVAIFAAALSSYRFGNMDTTYNQEMEDLREILSETSEEPDTPEISIAPETEEIPEDNLDKKNHKQTMPDAEKLADMNQLYGLNEDTVGWLTIDDTNIDYPVMQTPDDEEFYLDRDFNKNYSANGSLILDTESDIGTGTLECNYADGSLPSTNLIIHGHNMKNGAMFGNLDLYRKIDYEKKHNIIKLSTLTEKREYEIVSVFLSQVYLKSQTDVFKYYKFFEAYNEDEFNDFYKNIKELQLYDTGVTAEYGDEFITLSVCAYHVDNGRLVVVGKRIK
ncbi:MAG: class B sortase [Lachnospiraceae bacterium]|nr:class B sortase [Lachnospiraceae bacterium]